MELGGFHSLISPKISYHATYNVALIFLFYISIGSLCHFVVPAAAIASITEIARMEDDLL